MTYKHFILFYICIFGLNSCANLTEKDYSNKIVHEEYYSSYDGIVTGKYFNPDGGRPIIVIRQKVFGEMKKDFVSQSSEFYDLIHVGDTIIKESKSLAINLKRKNIDTIIKLDFGNIRVNVKE